MTPAALRTPLFRRIAWTLGAGGLAGLLIGVLTGTLALGPGDNAPHSPARGEANPGPGADPARAVTSGAQQRLLRDMENREVWLPGVIHGIATPGISMTSLILVLGGGDKLRAIHPAVAANPWLRRVFPPVGQLPAPFGAGSVNREELLAHRPDVVTLWSGQGELRQNLGSLGIPVLTLGYTTPAELQAAVSLLGRVLGPDEAAQGERYNQYLDANLARVALGLSTLPMLKRPRVYYATGTPLATEGGNSMINAWIEIAGGRNVAAEAGLERDIQVSLEEVLRWNPEIIVVRDRPTWNAIRKDPRWAQVAAVRQQRVFVNPGGDNAWCTRAAESALQILWAARIFHPEAFPNLDLGAELRAFYRDFYRYTLSDEEVQRILRGEPPPGEPG